MRLARWFILSLVFFTCHGEMNAIAISLKSSPAVTVITTISSGGYEINSPGTYVFGNDITWTPTGDGQAIKILADGVTLDLKHHTLESAVTSYSTVGILAEGVKNLTIKNGTVANFGLEGIHCEECLRLKIEHMVIDGLNMENTATYTVPVGILVNASENVVIRKCEVKNIDVKTGSLAAIQLTETISSKVLNCRVSNLLNRDGACTGIGHLLCDVAEVKSCTLDTLESQFIDNLNTEGHTAIGIVPVASGNLRIEKCRISNIIGCCDDAHGISVFECLEAKVKKCRVENVLDGRGAAQTGAKATGIEIYASGVEVSKCFVNNISAINPQDKQATGFSCAQCVKVRFIRCFAENVNVYDENGNQNSSLGYGTGFGWAPDPRIEFIVPAVDVHYKRCTAKHCQVGFDSWFHIDSLWEDVFSDRCGIAILDLDHSQRTLSCNPCSECGCLVTGCYPAPVTVTLDNVAENNKFINVRARY